MFHHGLVTLNESQPPLGAIPLRIPNEMVRGPLMENLQSFLQLNEGDIINMIKNPSVERVKNLIWSIVGKQQTLHDNSFSEAGLQGEIESALRACANFTGGRFIVYAERDLLGGRKRCDMVLIYEKFALLVEFKRIRPNALDTQPTSHPMELRAFCELWSAKSDEDLRSSPIVGNKHLYSQHSQVIQLEDDATKQALVYKQLLKEDPQFNSHQIRAFTVVQVGWPILVKEAK